MFVDFEDVCIVGRVVVVVARRSEEDEYSNGTSGALDGNKRIERNV
jgi:hypothetical protein